MDTVIQIIVIIVTVFVVEIVISLVHYIRNNRDNVEATIEVTFSDKFRATIDGVEQITAQSKGKGCDAAIVILNPDALAALKKCVHVLRKVVITNDDIDKLADEACDAAQIIIVRMDQSEKPNTDIKVPPFDLVKESRTRPKRHQKGKTS